MFCSAWCTDRAAVALCIVQDYVHVREAETCVLFCIQLVRAVLADVAVGQA